MQDRPGPPVNTCRLLHPSSRSICLHLLMMLLQLRAQSGLGRQLLDMSGLRLDLLLQAPRHLGRAQLPRGPTGHSPVICYHVSE